MKFNNYQFEHDMHSCIGKMNIFKELIVSESMKINPDKKLVNAHYYHLRKVIKKMDSLLNDTDISKIDRYSIKTC